MKFSIRFVLIMVVVLSAGIVNAGIPDKADDVTTHLEFMGYSVTNSDGDFLRATHDTHVNVVLKAFRGGVLLTAYVGGSSYAADHKGDFCELVNTLNANAAAVRYYVDSDIDLTIEGYYPGVYDWTSFSVYMEAFNLVLSELAAKYDELEKFLD